MAQLHKASITIGGVTVAGNGGIAWRLQTGTQPYIAAFTVHKRTWNEELKDKVGQFLDLVVNDSRGTKTTVRDVTILHTIPSDSPRRVTFAVADRRWKWQYKLVAKDFNIPRRTGQREDVSGNVPIEQQQIADEFLYREYSLTEDGNRWTPRAAVQYVGELLEGGTSNAEQVEAGEGGRFLIESFPIESQEAGTSDGQFSLQNVILRDQGDVALARLLSYVPGAEVYVDTEGTVRVFDGADLDIVERHYNELPPSTFDGDNATFIDRAKIRPSKVNLYYQREIEIILEYADQYIGGRTVESGYRTLPYIENVIPTVDPETEITDYDPVQDKNVTRTVPPGTWVRADKWLEAMDAQKGENSLPWTWDTVKRHWLKGNLEAVWGSRGREDLDPDGNVAMRVAAFKQHFRQTFRINRRYVDRVRDMQAVKVAVLDPVTGQRAHASVWGQACIIPTDKGTMMGHRKDPERAGVYRNVDYVPGDDESTIVKPPGPTRVQIVDRDIGIFRLDWLESPYGTVSSFVPCHLVGENDATKPRVPVRDLSRQDDDPIGPGMKTEGATNGIFLRDTLKYRVMITMMPCSPNDLSQFQKITKTAEDVKGVFRGEFRIQGGEGPELNVYVPPGELTARFAWGRDDADCRRTVALLFSDEGLTDSEISEDVDESQTLNGFTFHNEEEEIEGHATALAAELLAPFADALQGAVTTRVPDSGIRLRGNMGGATLQVAASPSAKVNVVHEFPGQQKPISRLALMPETTRHLILGILPYGMGDK